MVKLLLNDDELRPISTDECLGDVVFNNVAVTWKESLLQLINKLILKL